MASYQRIALYILFDAIEHDLTTHLRSIAAGEGIELLAPDEISKALVRSQSQAALAQSRSPDSDLISALDLGDKLAIINRHKQSLPESTRVHFSKHNDLLGRSISIRNSVMHGRPLTTTDYASAFSLAEALIKTPDIWPTLSSTYREYDKDPDKIIKASISFLDYSDAGETLNNLPSPDYDDTGFVPRPKLERDLKKKILGRHPVITVLGDGGNGKTALALQVLYGLVGSGDHDFDAICWVSAKSNQLTPNEIRRIEGSIITSLGVFSAIADQFEPGDQSPIDRVNKLLAENKILLVIDNLETVIDKSIVDFAQDVPGQSKILFTSRVPLGSDLAVNVDEFSDEEARGFLFRLRDAYQIRRFQKMRDAQIDSYVRKLGKKPLLIKWFALGVVSGLDPDAIVRNPEMALRFCMENVVDKLSEAGKFVARVMSTIPNTLSAAVLVHVSGQSATHVESGIAELLRYSLIERDDKALFERKYFMKPFARSYVATGLATPAEDVARYSARYRDSEAAFQFERAGALYDRYNPRSFVVRSRSEALAARRLRHAVSRAFRGKYDEAEREIDELKIVIPDYFEVFRADAFIGYKNGDFPRAHASYEAALELEQTQPQLFYFFAGFLMRAFNDYEGADLRLKKALAIDGNSIEILRELARNCFFLNQFDVAKQYIEKALSMDMVTIKDRIIFNDLMMQYFIRKAERQDGLGDSQDALFTLEELKNMLEKVDEGLIDDLAISHLRRSLSILDKLERNPQVDNNRVSAIRAQVNSVVPQLSRREQPVAEHDRRFVSGIMKNEGRTESFAFLRDGWGEEVYVSKSSVDPVLWQDMIDGVRVMFEIGEAASGKTFARNVTRL